MGERMIDPFNLLLNELSHKLSEKNLRSLIHICEIPDGSAESIKDGLALFRYLIHTNRIGKENIGNLRNLMRKMLPKRRDLVRLVDVYIEKEYDPEQVQVILQDFSDSLPEAESPNMPSHGIASTELFNLNNQYMYCGCRKIPSCVCALIVLLVLGIIFTSLCWYSHVPKISREINNNEDLKNGGVYIIICECLLLGILILSCLWKKIKSHRGGYFSFVNPTMQNESALVDANGMNTHGKEKVSAPMAYRDNYGSLSDPEGIAVSVGVSVSSAETVEPQNMN